MEQHLRAALLGDPDVYGRVEKRVDWGWRPLNGAMPAIVLIRVSAKPDICHDGASGLESARVQIDCWGRTYGEANALAKAVKRLMGRGLPPPFQGAVDLTETDFVDPGSSQSGDLTTLFRTAIDVMVWFTAA